MALILAIINILLYRNFTRHHIKVGDTKYLLWKFDSKGAGIKNFMSVYLIVNQFVPLDLLVAIELSKLIYTGLMEKDAEMVVPDYDLRDI